MQQSNREPPGIKFCSCPLRFVTSFPFDKAASTLHSIDRFANYLNAKLPRFNSRFWNPGSEGIDSFVMDWARENNFVCLPVCLVLLHMRNCKASGTLIVPAWHSLGSFLAHDFC